MDASRFDRLTRFFATRSTRRATIAAGAGTVAAVLGAGTAHATSAQATPEGETPPTFLYVQTFAAGTLEPLTDQPDRYALTLTGASASTIVFADHPSRQTNLLPTGSLPDVLSFDAANPPNAALVTRDDASDEHVMVIELLDPTYDPDTQTVTYQVIELADYSAIGSDLAAGAKPIDAMPPSFGVASLFIDSGGDGSCRDSLAVCTSSDQCCADFLCVMTTCTPDDPSQTSTVSTDLGMCMPPVA